MRERAHAWVAGRVQGVGFRIFTARAAAARGITGFVRNLGDGRVEAAAEGSRDAVEAFLADLARGPRGARVEAVRIEWESPAGDREFRVLPT